jgi:hypothetical protein
MIYMDNLCNICGSGLMHPITKGFQCVRCTNIQPGQPKNQNN